MNLEKIALSTVPICFFWASVRFESLFYVYTGACRYLCAPTHSERTRASLSCIFHSVTNQNSGNCITSEKKKKSESARLSICVHANVLVNMYKFLILDTINMHLFTFINLCMCVTAVGVISSS